ncbi:hypothetical protein [Salinibacterium sp.]|uniref:hypothetical protein n=1 Tax=Salinibacterium sp. TaxID=1915057 RepID=UPI00286A1054|nr:hypothetical protein [Salinibacterium sp.]
MAEREVSRGARRNLRVRYRLTPWWAKVLVVFVASRVVTTAILLSFAARQGPNAWTPAHPDYFDFAAIWDGHWYYIIAVAGYPSTLPVTADGQVGESAWAFMPAYPAIVRAFMLLTGQGFPVVSVFVSVTFALAAALMFYRLMHLVLPAGTALFAVVLFCVAPLSPILQVSYAESMHAFLLALALYLLMRRRYWMLIPVVAVMSLTRPSGLAFALAMLLHVAHRWRVQRPSARSRQEFPVRERVASITVGLFSAVMGVAWLLVAAVVTGSLTAYTDTEIAWRSSYIGYGELVPFTPWLSATGFWAPWFGMPQPLLLALLVLIVAGFFAALLTPWARRLGTDMRFWIASYALYLLAVFFPQSSVFRLLVPLFPALGVLAIPKSPVYRVVIVALCIAGQWAWAQLGWWVDGYDWTPP